VIVGKAPARGWKQLALYAACVVAIFALFMFLGRQWSVKSHAQLLAASAQDLSPPGMPLHIAASIVLTRTRDESQPALALPPRAGDVVELRLDLHAPETAARYSVELSRISGSALERLGTLAETATQGGTLAVFVRGSALTPGNYLIRVSAAGGSEPLEFTLRVEGQPR
jgi:small ligand-binding sensory domain FIST